MNKRSIFLVMVTVFVLLVGLGALFYMKVFNHKTQLSPTVTYQLSINKTTHYIQSHPDKISPYQWLLLDYLQRKYSLGNTISSDFIAQNVQKFETQTEFAPYIRIAQPDHTVTSLPSSTSPLDSMMIAAINCDKVSLPHNFSNLVQQNLKAGGYPMSHVSFVLQRLEENGCKPFDDQQFTTLKDEVVQAMAGQLGQKNTQDFTFELIAFLLEAGARDKVQKNFMDELVRAQLNDGSWSSGQNGTTTDDHATVLALWALLAYTQPNAKHEPMIRHKTSPTVTDSQPTQSRDTVIHTGTRL